MSMQKDHCVISIEAVNRTWGSEEEAIAHAKRIIESQAKSNPTVKVGVVKLVSIVELTAPPMTVRPPTDDDISHAPVTMPPAEATLPAGRRDRGEH